MSSWFVNPALLWGSAAIAAPIIIFLLTRWRYQTVEWAALVFLQRALKKEQRRLRLENLLLLLLRCLVLILFALALARPRAQADVVVNQEDVRKNVLVLLDTSYSMGYQFGSDDEETSFERARRAAKAIINGLEGGDRVLVVGFDEAARNLYAMPRQMDELGRREVTQELDDALELRRTERGTDLGEALGALRRVLDRFDLGPDGQPPPAGFKPLKKTVFLLTDCQRRGLLDAAGQLVSPTVQRAAKEVQEGGAELLLVDCGAEEPKNVGITRLASREPVVGEGLPCHIEVTIRNWSATDVGDLTVEYYVDGASTPQKVAPSLQVPAGEERAPEPLRYVFKEAGPHRVEVQVKSDGLVLDNRRHVVVDVRKSVRTLLVDGERSRQLWESETDFVYEVLKLSESASDEGFGLIHPEVVDEAGLHGKKLQDYDVVLLCNVAQLGEEQAAALEAYARAGGAVVMTMGSMVDREAWNERVWRRGAGLLPCKLLDLRGGSLVDAQASRDAPAWAMAVTDPHHPVGSLYAPEEMRTHLKGPTIFGFIGAEVPPPATDGHDPGVSVPFVLVPRGQEGAPDPTPAAGAREDGPPLLVEKRFGRGRALVFLTSIDYAWNNAVLHDGFYVPFWRQLVLDLAQRSRPPVNLPVGGRYERFLRAEEYAPKVEVETPDGRHEGVVLEKVEGEEQYRLAFPRDEEKEGLEQSGLYSVSRQGGAGEPPPPEAFAVAIDPDEGDLARFAPDELAEALDIPVRAVRHDATRDALRAEGGASSTREFWRHALACVVALLALESLLAAAFGRRRR
jgi:hypothetical protein